MKIKKLLLVAAALLGLTATSVAQNVPSYVPTNGLVGWWPFNGNANDESGNGNNGTVNGAVLSSDRFGNGNKSYNFNGTQNINITNSSIAAFLNNSFTCVAWFKTSSNLPGDIVRYDNCVTESGWGLRIGYNNPGQIQGLEFDNTRNPNFVTSNNVYNDGNWHLAVFKRDVSAMKDALFIDNQFITETSFSTVYNIDITGHPLFIGAGCDFFNGDLDDIGIWNRALNQQEITNFFNSSQSSSNCLPSYVPINGLIGYWPFCGNANDESGNGNNGIVYPNTTLTSDRNNFPLSAYLFDNSVQSGIQTNIPLSYTLTGISGALWFNSSVFLNSSAGHRQFISGTNGIPFQFAYNNGGVDLELYDQNGSLTVFTWPAIFLQNTWHHVVFSVNTSGNVLIAIDGQLNNSGTAPNSLRTATNSTFVFGLSSSPFWPNPFPGKLDDIGIWNRALTQQEVTNLYNATNCANNTTITPQTNTITAGSTANFTATTSDPNPAYVWQSDLGQGFQTLNNFGNYSGVNTASIHISNVQLSEHNQPIRVITTSGNCIDTSNVASILVSDTCITTMTDTSIVLITDTNIVTVTDTNYVTIVDTNYVTVNDTSFITVTDTLLIQTTITGINPPNNSNTLRVFPNPTNDHITIDYGNFSIMNGYQLKIENSLGQQVFQTNITQQSDYIGLMNWGGNGLYFVRIIDPQGNTIDIRKIVLQ